MSSSKENRKFVKKAFDEIVNSPEYEYFGKDIGNYECDFCHGHNTSLIGEKKSLGAQIQMIQYKEDGHGGVDELYMCRNCINELIINRTKKKVIDVHGRGNVSNQEMAEIEWKSRTSGGIIKEKGSKSWK